MKKLYSLLLCLFALSYQAFPQINYYYYPVQSGTTKNLTYIYSISSGNVFISGVNGTLLKSANSGLYVWNPVDLGTSNNLNSFMLKNTMSTINYYVFGDNGSIYLSSNSGGNWVVQNGGVTTHLNSGSVVTGDTVFQYKYLIVGTGGTIIYKLLVGGIGNWISLSGVTSSDLKSVYFIGKVGWIAGANGTILKSVNAGMNWTIQPTGVSSTLNSVYFSNTSKGTAVGNGGTILRTTNGGTNWTQVTSGTIQNLNQVVPVSNYDTLNFWIIGNSGMVLKSSNAGTNWTADILVPNYSFNSGYYLNNDLFVVGESGKIFRRTLDTAYHNLNQNLLEGNNIRSFFNIWGVFDQNINATNAPGFEWPKDANKFAIFTAGLNIAAKVNGSIRMSSGSYKGEYLPGYCVNGVFQTNMNFKYYKVTRGDNAQTNWDWANWGTMVPYGAPFIDVNNNGIYEPLIDTPGVSRAKETIFICLTDANPSSHTPTEGFGGGTLPIGDELRMTIWEYDDPLFLKNVQFIGYDFINKSTNTWNAVKTGIFCDADLGDVNDDFIGCDTALQLGYCYNGDNNDALYGINPPAVGMTLLRSPLNRSVTPNVRLKMTSFNYSICASCPSPACEQDANSPLEAYKILSGFKKDSTCWLDPTQNPYRKTKYTYSGDPETNAGWTEVKGGIWNCNHDSSGVFHTNYPGDRKFILSSGADNFNILPGESQKFVIAQLIARGTSNLNSVTRLKQLCDSVRMFYEGNFPIGINQITGSVPDKFNLFQNYPNPFNPVTNIKYQITKSSLVTLKVYDILGKEVETLVNEYQQAGIYEAQFPNSSLNNSRLSSGIYFYRLTAGDFSAVKRMILVK